MYVADCIVEAMPFVWAVAMRRWAVAMRRNRPSRGIGSKTPKSCEFAELVLLRLAGMASFPAAWQRG